jgi:hypothetical protein
MVVDPSRKFLYAISDLISAQVVAYTIGTNGVLTPVAVSSFALGGESCEIAYTGSFVYVSLPNS